MSKIKQARVSGRIRQILSELLLREVSDPRLQGLTITRVELDPELVSAKIWVNAMGEEDRMQEILFGLEHAKGFLRREVGKRVRLRKTPELHFRWDASLEQGERINRMIDHLNIPKEIPVPIDEDFPDDEDYDEDDDYELDDDKPDTDR